MNWQDILLSMGGAAGPYGSAAPGQAPMDDATKTAMALSSFGAMLSNAGNPALVGRRKGLSAIGGIGPAMQYTQQANQQAAMRGLQMQDWVDEHRKRNETEAWLAKAQKPEEFSAEEWAALPSTEKFKAIIQSGASRREMAATEKMRGTFAMPGYQQSGAAPSSEAPTTQAGGAYNVGNIRAKEGGFRQFASPEDAVGATVQNARAYPSSFNGGQPMPLWDPTVNPQVARQAWVKQSRGESLSPEERAEADKVGRTIAGRWAPYGDGPNDPAAWARNVSLVGGVDIGKPIDLADPATAARFARGVHAAEFGPKALYPNDVYERGATAGPRSGGQVAQAGTQPQARGAPGTIGPDNPYASALQVAQRRVASATTRKDLSDAMQDFAKMEAEARKWQTMTPADRERFGLEQQKFAADQQQRDLANKGTPFDREKFDQQKVEAGQRRANETEAQRVARERLELDRQQFARPPKAVEEIIQTSDAVSAGKNVVAALNRAIEINGGAISGIMPETQIAAKRVVRTLTPWDTPKMDATIEASTELDNLIKGNALENLRAVFGGNPTEGERKILIDLQGSLEKSPAERAIIFRNALQMAQQRIASGVRKGEALRSGTFLEPGGDPNIPVPAAPFGPPAAPAPAAPTADDLRKKYHLDPARVLAPRNSREQQNNDDLKKKYGLE